MPIRKRENIVKKAEKLANELSDRPYGDISTDQDEEYVVTSISITRALLHKAEDLVTKNKRANIEPKSVSALVRIALEQITN